MEAYIAYNLKKIDLPELKPVMQPFEPTTAMEPEEVEDEGIPDYEFVPLDDDQVIEDSQLFE